MHTWSQIFATKISPLVSSLSCLCGPPPRPYEGYAALPYGPSAGIAVDETA